MIWDWFLNYWYQFFDSKRVDRVHFVDEGLEVLHLSSTFEDHRQLVTCYSTVIEKHSVYDFGVEELARLS